MIPAVHCYIAELSAAQIQSRLGVAQDRAMLQAEASEQTAEQDLLSLLGMKSSQIAWSKVRYSAFDNESEFVFACCVDPVMVHTTHRGVYMMGQQPLSINRQQALEIVASINETLMDEDEQLLMFDPRRWLLVSKRKQKLDTVGWRELVGTDLFKFSYEGETKKYWHQKANEIQMLIHQLADYKKLIDIPPQTMLGVHFWDAVWLDDKQPIAFASNNCVLYADDPEMQQLCSQAIIEQQDLSLLLQTDNAFATDKDNIIWLGLDDETVLQRLLPQLIEQQQAGKIRLTIRTADQRLSTQKQGLFSKIGFSKIGFSKIGFSKIARWFNAKEF